MWSRRMWDDENIPVSKIEREIEMTFRERREAGLTFVNVLRLLKKRGRAAVEGADTSELAQELMFELVSENPKGWEDID
jgi:hypothetical protein